MPKELERKLKIVAKKKFPGNEERQNAYVYGTMRKTGWKPSTQTECCCGNSDCDGSCEKNQMKKIIHSVVSETFKEINGGILNEEDVETIGSYGPFTDQEKDVISKSINTWSKGGHPSPDRDNVEGFGKKWIEAMMKRAEKLLSNDSKNSKDLENVKSVLKKLSSKKSFAEGLSVPERHQLKIAIDTLKMHDLGAKIMGGMTKEEAKDFLKNKAHWSDDRIKRLESGEIKEEKSSNHFERGDEITYKGRAWTIDNVEKDGSAWAIDEDGEEAQVTPEMVDSIRCGHTENVNEESESDFNSGITKYELHPTPLHKTVKNSPIVYSKSTSPLTVNIGDSLDLYFSKKHPNYTFFYGGGKWRIVLTKNLYKRFSGFSKEPSPTTMMKWEEEGISKTVTGARVEPDGRGPDGSPSWLLISGLI